MLTVRQTGRGDEHRAQWGLLASLALLVGFVPAQSAAIGDGSTAGNLRTTATVTPKIGGTEQADIAATDDLWDLSGETNTAAATRRAYWLYDDGTFDAGADVVGDDAAALEALPAIDEARSVIGVYIAGPATDFGAALAAQGTIANQIPEGAAIGIPGQGYVKPSAVALVPA